MSGTDVSTLDFSERAHAWSQGLTLVHFSAQPNHPLGIRWVPWVELLAKTAWVELRSGRVRTPAWSCEPLFARGVRVSERGVVPSRASCLEPRAHTRRLLSSTGAVFCQKRYSQRPLFSSTRAVLDTHVTQLRPQNVITSN